MKIRLCDVCFFPSLRKWVLITKPWTLAGHKRCMRCVGLALEVPELSTVQKQKASYFG